MPFRSDGDQPSTSSIEVGPRFWELVAALDRRRSWYQARGTVLSAAALLVSLPLPAAEVAARTWAAHDELRRALGWWTEVEFSLRLVLATSFVDRLDAPTEVVEDVRRIRERFRALRLRRCGLFEVFAALTLRFQADGAVDEDRIRRLVETFGALRALRPQAVGDALLPICGLFIDAPDVAAARIDAVFRALAGLPRMQPGKPLMRTAGVLAVFGRSLAVDQVDPTDIAGRFGRMLGAFAVAGRRVNDEEWTAVAAACLLAYPSSRIVGAVVDLEDRLRSELKRSERPQAFALASTLAFAELVAHDPVLGSLAEIRSLLEMHAALTAAAAAAIGLTVVTGE